MKRRNYCSATCFKNYGHLLDWSSCKAWNGETTALQRALKTMAIWWTGQAARHETAKPLLCNMLLGYGHLLDRPICRAWATLHSSSYQASKSPTSCCAGCIKIQQNKVKLQKSWAMMGTSRAKVIVNVNATSQKSKGRRITLLCWWHGARGKVRHSSRKRKNCAGRGKAFP